MTLNYTFFPIDSSPPSLVSSGRIQSDVVSSYWSCARQAEMAASRPRRESALHQHPAARTTPRACQGTLTTGGAGKFQR